MTIQTLLQITISEVLSTLMHAVSVIIRESLVECGGKRRSAIWGIRVSRGSWGKLEWFSLDHHGDGDIVVIGWVLDFVSILLSNGFECVITDDLSEGLEGDAVNNIEGIGWGNLEGKSSLLIDWNRNELRMSLVSGGIAVSRNSGSGVAKMFMGGRSNLDLGHSFSNEFGGTLRGSCLRDHSTSQGKLDNILHY